MPMAAIHAYVGQKMIAQGAAARRLAPAPEPLRCKKKFAQQTYSPVQPASVVRRNARERNRVKQVNNGFAALRQHIPSTVAAALTGGRGDSRKLSKVDTLRLAVEYIRSLKRLLEEGEECGAGGGPQTPPSSEGSRSPAPSLASEEAAAGAEAGHDYRDSYDTYEPMSPEDEELLDVISWWQQQ